MQLVRLGACDTRISAVSSGSNRKPEVRRQRAETLSWKVLGSNLAPPEDFHHENCDENDFCYCLLCFYTIYVGVICYKQLVVNVENLLNRINDV